MRFLVLTLCVVGALALPRDFIREYAEKFPNQGADPEHGDLLEGDIETDGLPVLADQGDVDLLNAMWDMNKRWPDRVLYYDIVDEYSSSQLDLIQAGVDDLEDSCRVDGDLCVDLVKINRGDSGSPNNYVLVQKYSGCSSFIGMSGGSQRMSLVDSCVNRHGTIMHEFLHALGFHHEHKRADRDDYVYVNFDNIQPGRENNFNKLTHGSTVDHLQTEYDYGSVMHYSAYGFAIDNSIPTIVPHDPDAEIGQRLRMSDLDVERVQIFYCCLDARDSKYFKNVAHLLKNQDYCAAFEN